MSNSNNDEKKGKENNHNLARLVKEIFDSETRFQSIEEDLASEDLVHDPIRRAVVNAINKLLDKFLEHLIEYFEERERSYDFSQQSTGSS
jgi:CRISPR/Cas system CSM-associated protein Csm4 (group 5 of RAMP superfamily)